MRMSYKECLSEMINNSGKTLRQISKECEEKGVAISYSYISKLKNGDKIPPNDEINVALAKACNGDIGELIYEAYLDGAPEMVKKVIEELTRYFQSVFRFYLKSSKSYKDKKKFKEQLDSLNKPYKTFYIIAGEGLRKIDVLNDAMLIKSPDGKEGIKILIPKIGTYQMDDDSMQPTIYKDDKIQIDSEQMIKIGDIGVFQKEEDKIIIRRYFEKGNDKILLIPDNKKYKSETFDINSICKIGRVTAIIKEI